MCGSATKTLAVLRDTAKPQRPPIICLQPFRVPMPPCLRRRRDPASRQFCPFGPSLTTVPKFFPVGINYPALFFLIFIPLSLYPGFFIPVHTASLRYAGANVASFPRRARCPVSTAQRSRFPFPQCLAGREFRSMSVPPCLLRWHVPALGP